MPWTVLLEYAQESNHMSGQYAILYRRAREALESDAEVRLNRPLNTHERNLFRSCGTLTMLEQLGMMIYCAESAEELAQKLAETSMQSRFLLSLNDVAERLERVIGRSLSDTERQQLRGLGNTEALWSLEEQTIAADPDQYETVLCSLLPPL